MGMGVGLDTQHRILNIRINTETVRNVDSGKVSVSLDAFCVVRLRTDGTKRCLQSDDRTNSEIGDDRKGAEAL